MVKGVKYKGLFGIMIMFFFWRMCVIGLMIWLYNFCNVVYLLLFGDCEFFGGWFVEDFWFLIVFSEWFLYFIGEWMLIWL